MYHPVRPNSRISPRVRVGAFSRSFDQDRRNENVARHEYVQVGRKAPSGIQVEQWSAFQERTKLTELHHALRDLVRKPYHCDPGEVAVALRAEVSLDIQYAVATGLRQPEFYMGGSPPSQQIDNRCERATMLFTLDVVYEEASNKVEVGEGRVRRRRRLRSFSFPSGGALRAPP